MGKRRSSYCEENNVSQVSDEEQDEEAITNENADETIAANVDIIDPNTMLTLVKAFDDYIKQVGKQDLVRINPTVVAQFLEKIGEKDHDANAFAKSYRCYFAHAHKVLDLATMNSCLLYFLTSGSSTKMFPDYPKAPPSIFDFYAKKNGFNGVSQRGEVKQKMLGDQEGVDVLQKELQEMQKQYIQEIESFNRNHREHLNAKQKIYIDDQVKKARKRAGNIVSTPQVKKSKKMTNAEQDVEEPREIKTPFEWYQKINSADFEHYPEQKREKRMMKAFKKLDEEKKKIYEEMSKRM